MFITIIQLLLCLYCIYRIFKLTAMIFSQNRTQYQKILDDIKRKQKWISTMISMREEIVFDAINFLANICSPIAYAIFSIFVSFTCPETNILIFLGVEALLFLAEIAFYISFKKANFTANSFIMITDKIISIVQILASASILITLVPYLVTLI